MQLSRFSLPLHFLKRRVYFRTMLKLTTCLIVGRPWGQFQGCSISPICPTTLLIWALVNAVPTIIDIRQALLANILRTFDGLKLTPGLSLSINISSSISGLPKLQFLLPLLLKVVFLVRGMLVDYEEVVFQLGDDKTLVKLPDDFHLAKHIFGHVSL